MHGRNPVANHLDASQSDSDVTKPCAPKGHHSHAVLLTCVAPQGLDPHAMGWQRLLLPRRRQRQDGRAGQGAGRAAGGELVPHLLQPQAGVLRNPPAKRRRGAWGLVMAAGGPTLLPPLPDIWLIPRSCLLQRVQDSCHRQLLPVCLFRLPLTSPCLCTSGNQQPSHSEM